MKHYVSGGVTEASAVLDVSEVAEAGQLNIDSSTISRKLSVSNTDLNFGTVSPGQFAIGSFEVECGPGQIIVNNDQVEVSPERFDTEPTTIKVKIRPPTINNAIFHDWLKIVNSLGEIVEIGLTVVWQESENSQKGVTSIDNVLQNGVEFNLQSTQESTPAASIHPVSSRLHPSGTTTPISTKSSSFKWGYNLAVIILVSFVVYLLALIRNEIFPPRLNSNPENDNSSESIYAEISVTLAESSRNPTPTFFSTDAETTDKQLAEDVTSEIMPSGTLQHPIPTKTTSAASKISSSVTPSSSTSKPPDQFVQDYFALINNQDYDKAWSMLSPHFKDTYNSTGYGPFTEWWGKIKEVKIISIVIKSQSSSEALLDVEISYYFENGQVDTYDLVEFGLIFNGQEGDWLFNSQKLLKGHR